MHLDPSPLKHLYPPGHSLRLDENQRLLADITASLPTNSPDPDVRAAADAVVAGLRQLLDLDSGSEALVDPETLRMNALNLRMNALNSW